MRKISRLPVLIPKFHWYSTWQAWIPYLAEIDKIIAYVPYPQGLDLQKEINKETGQIHDVVYMSYSIAEHAGHVAKFMLDDILEDVVDVDVEVGDLQEYRPAYLESKHWLKSNNNNN